MLKGQDQTDARDFNIKAIVSYLRRSPLSCSELSVKTGLSKPALTKITVQMQELGLITEAPRDIKSSTAALGRKPSYFIVNPNCGCVAVVDFSTVKIAIRLSDMSGKIIAQHSIEDKEFITYDVLQMVLAEIRSMCGRYLPQNRKLLYVCLAASGMINKEGVIMLSPKFSECKGLNIREYFQKELNTGVLVKNDIKMLLYGEEWFGKSESKGAIALYIDSGIGGAISIDRKIVEGEEGFAGEFGLTTFSVGDDNVEFDNLSSINAMKRAVANRAAKGEPCSLKGKFRFKDLVAAFKEGDPLVKDVVLNSAEYVSKFITNIIHILNCHHILIAGRVRQLGEEYLGMIRKQIPESCNVEVNFNYLGDEAIMAGATSMAIEKGIEHIIESR